MDLPELTDDDRATFAWQMWVDGVGEVGQRRLKGASVLVSRAGGLGGAVAYELAAAGVGRLIIAHGGNLKPSDLNRQLLMTHDWIGKPRIQCIERRLKELNPRLDVVAVGANVSEANAAELVAQADVVVDAAPLFPERYALNRAAVAKGVPMVECAVYDLDLHVTTFAPGRGCLACLYPEPPPTWKRQFPVFGAVSGTAGCLGAAEVIKLITGIGEPLIGTLLMADLRRMRFRRAAVPKDPACPVCSAQAAGGSPVLAIGPQP
ncbi:hypothetical protein LBMAG53_00860 [Planctomycetota bacterium]|nr:hypothetical protein LBMAG53_00860 [Planctomycetota bacterium]